MQSDCLTKESLHAKQQQGERNGIQRKGNKREEEEEEEGLYLGYRQEEWRVTSRRAGLETHSAGSLGQHKDGGGLGGEAPPLSLPREEDEGRKQEVRGRRES